MAFGQTYDDAGDYGAADSEISQYDAFNPPPGMMFDWATQRFVPNGNGNTAINPLTGKPYTGLENLNTPDAHETDGPKTVPPPPGPGGPPPGPGTTNKPPPGSIDDMDPSAQFVYKPPTGMPGWMPDAPAAPGMPNLPTWRTPPAFEEPDYESLMANDKGYKATLDTGRGQMEASAAARGVLNGGGTLKDITSWGQNMGAQYVRDAKDRAVNNYLLNYQTQYADPYNYAYKKAMDTFTGGLNLFNGATNIWDTKVQAGQRNAEDEWQQQYTPFNDLWNRRITVGLN